MVILLFISYTQLIITEQQCSILLYNIFFTIVVVKYKSIYETLAVMLLVQIIGGIIREVEGRGSGSKGVA